MKKTYATVTICLLAACLTFAADTPTKSKLPKFEAPKFAGATAYPVLRVVDGDTIVVLTEKSKTSISTTKVSLIGVDTPETVRPSKPIERYGKEASTFLTNLLKGEEVYLLYEGKTPTKDTYGQLLAYVYRAPNGLFVNAEIVRQGYGHAYVKYPFKYMEQFKRLESAARSAKRGLWSPERKSAPVVSTPKKKPVKAPAKVALARSNAEVARRLDTRVSKLDFEDMELSQVFQFFRDVSGVNIYVKWRALALAGIEQKTTVNVRLSNVTFRKALETVLEDIATGGKRALGYVINEGVITISTKADLGKSAEARGQPQ